MARPASTFRFALRFANERVWKMDSLCVRHNVIQISRISLKYNKCGQGL